MTDTSWYEEMASAMRERDRALTGLARWQQSLHEAETRIQELRRLDTENTALKESHLIPAELPEEDNQ